MKNLIVTIFCVSSCFISYSVPAYESVKEIAAAIAKHNVYESAIIGFAATPSTQNERLAKLIKIASDKELFALTKNENAVVRLYALRAIVSRKLSVSLELKNQFYADNAKVVTVQGCIADNSSVAIISKMILNQKEKGTLASASSN